jgi:hypothetical protein
MFGFAAGAYSYTHGVVELFADLRLMAQRAANTNDSALLDRIFQYALWADDQKNTGRLRSAADIEFFMRLFNNHALASAAASRMPPELLAEKRTMAAGIVG